MTFNSRGKFIFALGLALGIDSGAHATAAAVSIATEPPAADRGDETVEALQQKLNESRKTLVEAEAQKRRILGSLYVINQRMKKISTDKSHLTNELFQVQDNVKTIAKIIAGLEIQIDKQRVQLRKRLRALYKMSGQGYLGALFSSGNSLDLDETLRFMKIVTDNDYNLIRSFRQNIASYKAQKNKLRGQIEKLVVIEKNIKRQEGLLANEHHAKSKIVGELDREKIASLNRIKTLRSHSEKIAGDANLSDLLKPSIYEQRGQLPAPAPGTVVQDFGLVTDEHYKIRLSHKGWRYSTAPATPVAAIFEGTVIHADQVDGYGPTVIIDHGDHYYTVYAQISHLKVKTGDTLKKGDILAEAGPAAGGYGEGFYFEIRHFSEPENPANWIAKKEYHQASITSENEL